MDVNYAVTFIFEDQDWWKKTGIGMLLILTIIGGPAFMGWVIEIIRRVNNDHPEPLPSWENIGDYYIDGLRMLLVTTIWSLPMVLIYGGLIVFMFMNIDNIEYTQYTASTLIAQQTGDSDQMFFMFIIVFNFCGMPLVMIYSLALMALYGPMMSQLAANQSLRVVINPVNSIKLLRANLLGYFIAGVVGYGIMYILGMLGIVLCFVGSYFGSIIGYAIYGQLIGQAYNGALSNIGNLDSDPVIEAI